MVAPQGCCKHIAGPFALVPQAAEVLGYQGESSPVAGKMHIHCPFETEIAAALHLNHPRAMGLSKVKFLKKGLFQPALNSHKAGELLLCTHTRMVLIT